MHCNSYYENHQNIKYEIDGNEYVFFENQFLYSIENLNICQSVKLRIKGLFEDIRCKECINSIFSALPLLTLEELDSIQGHPWASLLLASLSLKHPETGESLFSSIQWREWAASLSAEELIALMHTLFMKPELLKYVPFGETIALTIKRYGACEHTFSVIPHLLMKGETSSKITLRENDLFKALHTAYKEPPLGETIPFLGSQELEQLANKHFEVFGRTLVCFENTRGEEGIAYKFRREGEGILSFRREQKITEIFRESQKFLSRLPKPIGVFRMKTLPDSLKIYLSKESIDSDQPMVYIQEVPRGYYEYIHLIEEDEAWRRARKALLVDTGVQIAHGYMPDLAPLYHAEEERRHYQPLVDLIPMERKGSGAGNLEAPFPHLRWPNAGASGIRDVGDGSHLEQFIENPFSEGTDLLYFKQGKTSYFFMNSLAKTFLVDTLLLFLRFEKMGKGCLSWEDEQTVEKVAAALKEGTKWVLEGFTGYNETMCCQFIEAFPVDWKQQALQLIFWLQTDERGYLSYLLEKKLPVGLYDPEIKIEINLEGIQNFDPKRGFFKGDEKELGCYDGPLGWSAHEKGWYGIAAVALGVYYYHQADIKKEKIQEIQEKERKVNVKGKTKSRLQNLLEKPDSKRRLFESNPQKNVKRQKLEKNDEEQPLEAL